MWMRNTTSGQITTAKMAEPIWEVVLNLFMKWWLDATITPMTSQTTVPSETR